jgi:hypothetical protein
MVLDVYYTVAMMNTSDAVPLAVTYATALSMISTVVVSTFAHISGIAVLTKIMPATKLMLKNGSTYVDLPNFEATSLFEPEFVLRGFIVAGS